MEYLFRMRSQLAYSFSVKERGLSHLLEFVENQEATAVDEASGINMASSFFIPQSFIRGV